MQFTFTRDENRAPASISLFLLMCASVLFLAVQSPPTTTTPAAKQILSIALERLRSYPEPAFAVWTDYWFISRTAPQLVTSTTGGWSNKTSTWHRAERFALRTSDGLQNVTWSIPARYGPLPDAHFSSVFEGPFAWSLRAPATLQAATPSPMHPDLAGLKTIASVVAYAQPIYSLALLGTETVDGHSAYHLQLHPLTDPERHNLRDLWVDVDTFDI